MKKIENSIYYIELSPNPIRFDAVSQLTSVFFDDTNNQIFAVRSGGATGVVVKGPAEENIISFCMSDRGAIRSIKFSPDNHILALQRRENMVEFICFNGDQPQLQNIINIQLKALIYGFVWIHSRECVLISNIGIEIFIIIPEKYQMRSVKSLCISVKWFAWCSEANIALLCTTESAHSLLPVLIKQKSFTRLPKLECGSDGNEIQENKVTLGVIYGVITILILNANPSGMIQVNVYQLNGPGLAPQKCHVLCLGLVGCFAINTIDNLIVVHHQASATSMLFDIALTGEVRDDVTYHKPITPARSIRPFALKLPSLLPDGQTMQCDLYSTNWVLFQPNIVIDAKLGCMWYLHLNMETLCNLISDRIRLTEFLLQRTQGKMALMILLRQMINEQHNGTVLPVLEVILNKINKVYAAWAQMEMQQQIAQPSNVKINISKNNATPPTVLIEQSDMIEQVIHINGKPQCETILLLYLQSLCKYSLSAQEDLSKMLIDELIRNKSFTMLRHLVDNRLLMETKTIACYLLAQSNEHPIIVQTALDMLSKIKAHYIIIEVLLGQGKVIDALRIAKNTTDNNQHISARKFLEAAVKTNNKLIFCSVFNFFQMRNRKQYGTNNFLKTEQCAEFVQYYQNIINQQTDNTITTTESGAMPS